MTKTTKLPIRPHLLLFPEIDEPPSAPDQRSLTYEAVVRFLCTPGVPMDLETIKHRYLEITQQPQVLQFFPSDNVLLERIAWPLRHAKASYIVGNYLGTVSLCGMVAEMLAIAFFGFQSEQSKMTKENQARLFGSSFEKLGQKRRVEVLRALGMIDDQTEEEFNRVCEIRRKYLHFLSRTHKDLPKDAVAAFLSTAMLVERVFGFELSDNTFKMNQGLFRYLKSSTDFPK